MCCALCIEIKFNEGANDKRWKSAIAIALSNYELHTVVVKLVTVLGKPFAHLQSLSSLSQLIDDALRITLLEMPGNASICGYVTALHMPIGN